MGETVQGRIVGVAMLVLVVAACASGCGSTTLAGGTGKCAMSAENPHHSKGSPGWIVAKARYGCNIAADSVHADVVLQQYISGTWRTIARDSDNQTPVVPNKQYTLQATVSCRSGSFRTATHGYGYLRGVKSASTAWDYSQTVTNPCS